MKILSLIFSFASFGVIAGENAICKGDVTTRSFLSEWREGDTAVSILTNIRGLETFNERGRIAYQGDLNDDGNVDYIFESFDSEGSAKDRTFGIYVQCKGFLKPVGGDYFSGVNDVRAGSEKLKEIVFLSYQRDESNNIIYTHGKALTKPHVWSFNPNTGRYEGDMD